MSCSKQEPAPKISDPKLLREDVEFINLTKETYDYLDYLANVIKEQKLNKSEVLLRLQKIQSKNVSSESQMDLIDSLFKTKISDRLVKHIKVYTELSAKLNSRYISFSEDVIAEECARVLARSTKGSLKNREMSFQEKTMLYTEPIGDIDCGWRYYLCAGAATAGAILCHGACDATAIPLTAGIGIGACVFACGTLQSYAMVECADKYCSTKNN